MERRGFVDHRATLPPLRATEERRLLVRAKSGDAEATETLVRANLLFVVFVAQKYEGRGLDMDELIAEGNQGLLDAIEKYDLAQTVKFVRYAVWWVKQKMFIALARHATAMTLPPGRASDVYRVHKAQSVLRQALHTEPTLPQLVAATGLTASVVEGILTARHGGVVSLSERPTGSSSEDGGRQIEERIESALLTNAVVEQRELTDSLAVLLAKLPPRQETILRLYFGLDGGFEFTLEEIAHAIGVTRERVRQLRDQRLAFLREHGARLRAS